MDLSIILPTFNEKGNINKLIESIKINLKAKKINFEIIVVDDNSPDGTAEICKKQFESDKDIKIFVRKKERGLASAIHHGINKAVGKYILVMDTDFSHDPKLIPQMVESMKDSDIVIGSRYVGAGGMKNQKRYWLSHLYNLYLRILFRIPVTDFLSGYFCIKRQYLFNIPCEQKKIFVGYGDYFMRLIFFINLNQGKFTELASFYRDRSYGQSKTNLLKTFILYTKTSINLATHKS